MLPVVWLQWMHRSNPYLRWRDAVAAAIACAAAVLMSGAGIAIHGTSLRGILITPLQQASTFPTVFVFVLGPVTGDAVRLSAAVLMLLLGIELGRRRWPDAVLLKFGLCVVQLTYGMWVFYSVYALMRVSHLASESGTYSGSNPGALFSTGLPFVWLAMVACSERAPAPGERFARALLCTLAVIVSLQVYPVPGSQLTLATVVVILAAAVCLHDALSTLSAILPAWMRADWARMSVRGLLIVMLLMAQWGIVRTMRQSYRSLIRLDLPGARRVRMPEESVALYRWLTLNLRAHADKFVSMPAINSLYFWTEQEPPTGLNTGAWILLLDDTQQQSIVDSLAGHPNVAAVVVPRLTAFWLRRRPMRPQPLATYLEGQFETVGVFRGYEFRVRTDRQPPELTYCARRLALPVAAGQPSSWLAEMSLPIMHGHAVHRVSIVDGKQGRTLADTQPVPGGPLLEVIGERTGGIAAPLALTPDGVDLGQPRRLTLRIASPGTAFPAERLIVRLFDERDVIFASLPVISS
jgi:hypothetical protein